MSRLYWLLQVAIVLVIGLFPFLPEELRETEESFTVHIAFSLSNR